MSPHDWPSLAGQLALARRLHGDARGARVAGWLSLQRARVDDPAFARRFSDHIDLPGVASGDYNHRLIETPRGALLGGVRFYGRDVARPFVEVVAHGFEPTARGSRRSPTPRPPSGPPSRLGTCACCSRPTSGTRSPASGRTPRST